MIVDDTPGVVIVTGFDSIRREIAKLALEKLIQDGRIHPTRIEEIVKETQEEMEQHIRRLGQEAALEANVVGPARQAARLPGPAALPHQLLAERAAALAGSRLPDRPAGRGDRLERRRSAAAAACCTTSARPPTTRWKGAIPLVGAELARRYGESKEVIHAALGHHDDLRVDTPYTVLVAAADAISASRPGPGARPWRSTSGGSKSWNARPGLPGRRAGLCDPGRPRDPRDRRQPAARRRRVGQALPRHRPVRFKSQLTYPGEVKVTVLRETRTVEFAR